MTLATGVFGKGATVILVAWSRFQEGGTVILGQSVIAPTGGATYYTPWMPRQGDAFTQVVEFMRSSGALSMTCLVQTKNNEDSDASATNLGAAFAVSTASPGDVTTANRSGALELVRCELTVTGTSATRWVHFRSNPPIWQPN